MSKRIIWKLEDHDGYNETTFSKYKRCKQLSIYRLNTLSLEHPQKSHLLFESPSGWESSSHPEMFLYKQLLYNVS
jgi:hypothetical protein